MSLHPFQRGMLTESMSEVQSGHELAKGGNKQVADLIWAPGWVIEISMHFYHYSCHPRANVGCGPPEGGPATLPGSLISTCKWGGGWEHPAGPAVRAPRMQIWPLQQRWPWPQSQASKSGSRVRFQPALRTSIKY